MCVLMIFQYLGCIEVFESRGMQVCEEAVKALKAVSMIYYYTGKDTLELTFTSYAWFLVLMACSHWSLLWYCLSVVN